MLRLIASTFGNLCRDPFGNRHTAVDDIGLTVIRSPGRYRGRHRRY